MRITRWGGAAVFGLAVALAVATPAAAQDGHFPASGWDVRQIGTGETDWSPAVDSSITSSSTVELTKPDGTTGTSIETTNLELEVAAGDTISVQYELDGADHAAGAIRLFYYSSPGADTLAVAPTAFVAADGSGALELEVAAAGTIGTFGLTYDASNASAGTVRFSNLEVAGTPILFVAPEPEPSPTPAPDPTGKPSPDPDPTDPAAPGQGGEKPGLPVTGSPVPILAAGGGAALAGLGGLALWLTRRRRGVSFTA